MSLLADIQSLEPGSIVELFEIDAENLGAGIFRFHADLTMGPIVFQGKSYSPWPIKADGFQMQGKGKNASPSLTVGNVDGFVTALCLSFRDLVGASFYRRRTLAQYLDGAPEADPDEEFPVETWRIEVKKAETNEQVSFELSSPIDFRNQLIPARQIVANLCPWRYRGDGCMYNGPPVADINDNPTTDPALDDCSHYVKGCKLRFGEFGELPHGGFPSAGQGR